MKRVVTGLNEKGQSAVLEVGPPPRVWTWTASQESAPHHVSRTLIDHFPDLSELAPSQGVCTELWVTHTTASTVEHEDPGISLVGVEPGVHSLECPPGVTRWNISTFGPGYRSKMHCTETIDYDIVLAGEMYLILEADEIRLTPGDAVLVPGLQHCWRTETGGSFAYTMVSPFPFGALVDESAPPS